MTGFDVARASVADGDVADVVSRHFALMRSQSPPESCHVLSAEALTAPDVHLFALREAGVVLAIGALQQSAQWGELKSMHTTAEARGRGAGRAMLAALIAEARALGLCRLNLETGSGHEHAAARGLYHSAGFRECPPFGEYSADPLSVFMCRAI